MHRLHNAKRPLYLIAVLMAFLIVSFGPSHTVAAAPSPEEQAAIDKACEYRIFAMPTWFRGLSKIDGNGNCGIMSPADLDSEPGKGDGIQTFVLRIALNVIEIGLFIVGYIAIFFVLYGGFQFLTGGANPSQIEKARMTILNAVIGLAISIGAIAIVNLIFGIVG